MQKILSLLCLSSAYLLRFPSFSSEDETPALPRLNIFPVFIYLLITKLSKAERLVLCRQVGPRWCSSFKAQHIDAEIFILLTGKLRFDNKL